MSDYHLFSSEVAILGRKGQLQPSQSGPSLLSGESKEKGKDADTTGEEES